VLYLQTTFWKNKILYKNYKWAKIQNHLFFDS